MSLKRKYECMETRLQTLVSVRDNFSKKIEELESQIAAFQKSKHETEQSRCQSQQLVHAAKNHYHWAMIQKRFHDSVFRDVHITDDIFLIIFHYALVLGITFATDDVECRIPISISDFRNPTFTFQISHNRTCHDFTADDEFYVDIYVNILDYEYSTSTNSIRFRDAVSTAKLAIEEDQNHTMSQITIDFALLSTEQQKIPSGEIHDIEHLLAFMTKLLFKRNNSLHI